MSEPNEMSDESIESLVSLVAAAEQMALVMHLGVADTTRFMLQSARAIQRAQAVGGANALLNLATPNRPQ